MPHNYNSSILYEKTWHPIADAFYHSKYPIAEILRYTDDSKNDLEFQRKDIDLTLKFEDKEIHLSEKFRKEDYGDFLIELYSKYPEKKGWMENNEADFIAYFTSQKVYFINKKELVCWYQSEDFLDILKKDIEIFHQENSLKSARKKIQFHSKIGNNLHLNLIQAYNKTKDADWHTISIAMTWEDMIREGLRVKSYDLVK